MILRPSISEITTPHFVIVEGRDDAEFFEALAQSLSRTDQIQIACAGGKGRIREFLRTATQLRGFDQIQSLTLVRDVDGDRTAALRSLQGCLANVKLSVPSQPYALTNGNPRTGLILLPETGVGCLETLLFDTIERRDVQEATRAYLAAIDELDPPNPERFSPTEIEKRKLAPILAIGQRNPRTLKPALPVYVAIQAHTWDWNNPRFATYLDYLRSL